MKYSDVIFDFGNVLVKYSPETMVAKQCDNLNDSEILVKTVFDRSIWDRLDDGSLSDDEAVAIIVSRLPTHLAATGERIYRSWIDNLPETEGMMDLVKELKANGCRVFVLSNISKTFSQRSNEIPILSLFDGAVFSADIGIVKPDLRIFDYICNKYSIEPSHALFIDDNKANISAAKIFGLETWKFCFDTPSLRDFIFRGD